MAIETLLARLGLAPILFSISALVLASGYTVEYGFGIKPCIMCLYQRIPYYALLALSTFQLMFFFKRCQKLFRVVYVLLCLSSAVLALYHVSIERGFVEEPAACSVEDSDANLSPADIKTQIYEHKKGCKEVKLRIFGFSMAEMNLVLSTMLTVFCLML